MIKDVTFKLGEKLHINCECSGEIRCTDGDVYQCDSCDNSPSRAEMRPPLVKYLETQRIFTAWLDENGRLTRTPP